MFFGHRIGPTGAAGQPIPRWHQAVPQLIPPVVSLQSKNAPHSQGEYDVYSTFQSHEPEFDYLKSLEIEEKINKIKWLPQQNAAHSLLSTNGEPSLGSVEAICVTLVVRMFLGL